MKTFQVHLRDGRTANVQAETYDVDVQRRSFSMLLMFRGFQFFQSGSARILRHLQSRPLMTSFRALRYELYVDFFTSKFAANYYQETYVTHI